MRTTLATFSLVALSFAGCGDDTSPGVDLGADQAAAVKSPGIAVVRGTLKGAGGDGGADSAKAAHDGLVGTIKPMVLAAGDTGHTVFLSLADSSKFLSVDGWDDLAAAKQVYSSSAFQQAFGSLFSDVPTIDYYVAAPNFHTYGTIKETTNGLPSFGFVLEGTLKSSDPAVSSVSHNNVLDPNKAAAQALGDLAHVPNLAEKNAATFFNIDIWGDAAKAQMFFTDPNVQTAFGGLFTGAPTVTPYAATDWAQW